MGDGPLLYANWVAFDEGRPGAPAWEYALFSDAILLGDVRAGLGPYKLFNTVSHGPEVLPGARLAIVLRMDDHLEPGIPEPDWSKTEVREFSGLALYDEFAVLLALSLGFRCRGGGATRWFRQEPDADPLGEPIQWRPIEQVLPVPQSRGQIPRLKDQQLHLPDCVELMALLPRLESRSAARLIRAAHLYRNALWVCDADPSQAWLFLVSAVETVAQDIKAGKSIDTLEEYWPEVAEWARATNAPKDIVRQLARQTKATDKFVRTILKYAPPPPETRPDPRAQVDWDNLKDALKSVYDWRSVALHEGQQMPPSMCFAPYFGTGEPMERMPNAMSVGPGVWTVEDSPMLLHVFEHIARWTITAWWRDRASRKT